MYLKIDYESTSLFSLKKSEATNSAGKSLFSPSPYSVKMALLNAIISYDSLQTAKENFNLIRDLEISFKLPNNIIVNNCFIKIMKDNDKASPEEKLIKPFKSTVAFREYVYLGEYISFIVEAKSNKDNKLQQYEFLKKWFLHINYFGKKGCFFQFINAEIRNSFNTDSYSKIFSSSLKNGIIVQLDDMQNKNTFDDVNNYTSNKTKREKKLYIFPYHQSTATKNYTVFQRNK